MTSLQRPVRHARRINHDRRTLCSRRSMNIYTDWRNDRSAVGIGAMTVIATLAVPFLASATSELSWWINLLLGAAILFVGGTAVYRRLRRRTASTDDMEPLVSKHDQPVEEPRIEQGDQATQTPRWQVVEESIRKAPIVSGEGPILLLGYARVAAVGQRETEKLYYCKLHDVKDAHSYFEFRVNPPSGRLVERESEIRLLPGEIITSKRVWSASDESANNNVVADWRSLSEESRELIHSSESMVIVWKDTISHGGDRPETKINRLVVPVDGLHDVEEQLARYRAEAVLRFAPV